MKNQELSKLLFEIAEILELKGVDWKPQAYRRAAQSIDTLSEDIEEVYKEKGEKGLREIPGVGEAIAAKIAEFLKKGKVARFEEIKKSIPPGLKDLMEVSGLGPKKAMFLYKKLGIKSVADLEKAIRQHKVSGLEKFGEKSEENISRGVEIFKKGQERKLLGEVLPIATSLVEQLKKNKEVQRVEYAGSLRRMKETIGDIDLLATSSKPAKVIQYFTSLPDVKRILAQGPTKATVILKDGMQADLRVLKEGEYGSAMQYFIGNKEHNIKLREIAIRKGLKLSEYGLFKRTGLRAQGSEQWMRIAGSTEEGIYKKLGLEWIPPELRENTGEIEAAQKGALPSLIELRDMKGDLHVHTKYSDGNDSIGKMVEAAAARGYEYIAITDHSKSRANAGGLSESELQKQWKEIDALNRKQKRIHILKGTECDILADGSLDYSDRILSKFDLVVASIHSGFKATERQMTERICRALGNKYVTILGHPTGRLINRRPPYEVDMEQIFQVARKNKKILEINSFPRRLDLNDSHIRAAKNAGCRFSIDTDSHSFRHLAFIHYGVAQARRGWLEEKDVVNAHSLKELIRILKKDI